MRTNSNVPPDRFDAPRPAAYLPPAAERNAAHWKINGFPATIYIWTSEEWDRMEVHPEDAQYYPCGIWCALRMNPPF